MVKHDVILRGYGSAQNDKLAPPLIAKRTESSFVPALLDDLRLKTSAATLAKPGDDDTLAIDGQSRRRLFQPVHRTFNLVVLEAVCDAPDHPRIHPSDIVSAGFVVRRVTAAGQPDTDEAWQLLRDQPTGWTKPSQPKIDPDPAHRRPTRRAGHPYINSLLAQRYASDEPPAERTSPLFIAPPEICQAAGRTLLYGVIPVTSAEEETLNPEKCIDLADVRDLLPDYLKAGAPEFLLKVDAGGELTRAEVDEALASTDDTKTQLTKLATFVYGLRALGSIWNLFAPADHAPPENATLFSLLDRLEVRFIRGVQLVLDPGQERDPFGFADVANWFDFLNPAPHFHYHLEYLYENRPLRRFLADAAARFVDPATVGDALELPDIWPRPDATLAEQIAVEARRLLVEKQALNPPRLRRFENDNALYRLRAFVRVRHTAECPPHLHWSEPSEPYAIVPWWESGPTVHNIALPDIGDFAKLKPNVSFTLPPKLANLLNQGDAKKLLKGEGKLSGNPAISWICSFSIPIITICAFIVLNIILQLLHLFLGWMFFVKICLPFKKPAPSSTP